MQTTKTIFSCQKCEAQTAKWAGRCLECGTWGSLIEEVRSKNQESKVDLKVKAAKPMALHEIQTSKVARLTTGIEEVDRVLGGGIVAGSTILLAGEPGIGKSTLVAQIACKLGNHHPHLTSPIKGEECHPAHSMREQHNFTPPSMGGVGEGDVLYISGEESPEQLKERFDRLGKNVIATPIIENGGGKQSMDRHAPLAMTQKGSVSKISILPETNTETIAATIESLKPSLTIIDSVQTLTADAAEDAGAITQLRASTAIINETAKRTDVPILLIGQVTKSLDIAGPKSLEHLVDVVLTFEGDRSSDYRILRAEKNRFGGTGEIGVFEMTDGGLVEVKNPSAAFLQTRSNAPGSVVTCVLEGSRPILVEIQALASRSNFPYPERRASGFDLNRLNLLIAVLNKLSSKSKLNLNNFDVHVNVTSGFRVREPAADLAVLLAIISSLADKPIPKDLIAFGEVGLGGELRPVRDAARRVNEGKKLNFQKFIIPAAPNTISAKDIHYFCHLSEVISFLGLG